MEKCCITYFTLTDPSTQSTFLKRTVYFNKSTNISHAENVEMKQAKHKAERERQTEKVKSLIKKESIFYATNITKLQCFLKVT